MKVAVVCDSAANLPSHLADRLDITVVPMVLKFGERVSLDGVDISPAEFYRALVEQRVDVSTSAPSMGDFRTAFETARGRADAVVCVTVASFVSASHGTAVAAAREVGEDVVRVVDSRSASLGEGFPAIEAARAAAAGASLEEVVARAEDVVSRTTFAATIDTFEFLRRSGRVNALIAYAATTLNIKPVFAFRHGKVEQLGRPRTRSRALDRLIEELHRAAGPGTLHAGVAHAACGDEAAGLATRIRADFGVDDVLVTEFTPLMGAHTGPGVLGVGFWSE